MNYQSIRHHSAPDRLLSGHAEGYRIIQARSLAGLAQIAEPGVVAVAAPARYDEDLQPILSDMAQRQDDNQSRVRVSPVVLQGDGGPTICVQFTGLYKPEWRNTLVNAAKQQVELIGKALRTQHVADDVIYASYTYDPAAVAAPKSEFPLYDDPEGTQYPHVDHSGVRPGEVIVNIALLGRNTDLFSPDKNHTILSPERRASIPLTMNEHTWLQENITSLYQEEGMTDAYVKESRTAMEIALATNAALRHKQVKHHQIGQGTAIAIKQQGTNKDNPCDASIHQYPTSYTGPRLLLNIHKLKYQPA